MNNTTSFGDRLRMVMEKKGWTPTELAVELGVTTTMVYEYFKRRSMPNSRKFQKLLKTIPEINEEWLSTGVGEMVNSPKPSKVEELETETYGDLDLYNLINLVEEVQRLRDRVSRLENQLYNKNQKK